MRAHAARAARHLEVDDAVAQSVRVEELRGDRPERPGVEPADAREVEAPREPPRVRVDADAESVEVAQQLVDAVAKEEPAVEHADVRVAFLDDGAVQVDLH